MICEHYWREGIVLVEHGEPDPHRDTCVVCQREHEVRDAIVLALPLVGRETAGDPGWEARVWRRIARLEPRRDARRWLLGGALATAFAVVVVWWALARAPVRLRIEVVQDKDAIARRSTSVGVGDRIRITAGPTDEVRLYRGDRLVLPCGVRSTADGCVSDARGLVAEALLVAPGDYRIVIITLASAAPVGRLDLDLRAIISAGGEYQITELSVR